MCMKFYVLLYIFLSLTVYTVYISKGLPNGFLLLNSSYGMSYFRQFLILTSVWQCLNSNYSYIFYTPARRRLFVRPSRSSVRHTFGFWIIIKVPLHQIFSNIHTLLCTIKYRLCLITVYFTFTVHELWPFFS
jgi:hypothetical protein